MSASEVQVKICGLGDVASARVAVQAGADALGFILAPSRRQIAPEALRSIRDELYATNPDVPPMVGVVVNASARDIASLVEIARIDMIQLSGDERPELVDDLDLPVIKALRFRAETSRDDARREIMEWIDRSRPVEWLLVEGHAAGSYGGTGTPADWDRVAELASERSLWLAGGLHPENIAEAIRHVAPVGVDVSSGIETGGAKDHDKIRQFIHRAKSARTSD